MAQPRRFQLCPFRPALRHAVMGCVAWALCMPVASAAKPPDPAIGQMHHAIWTAKEGAPADIWAISQTRDGWMWFGSPDGLYRFDGMRFERVETEPESSDRSRAVSALMGLSSGGLVVGYRNGGVALLQDGRITNFHEADGFDSATVFDMSSDLDGRIWVATRNGLHRFDGRRWRKLGAADGMPDGAASALLTDQDGRVWLATPAGILTLERGASSFVARSDTPDIMQFVRSPDGQVWYVTQTELRRAALQPAARITPPLPPSTVSLTLSFDPSGAIWALDDFELLRFSPTLLRDRLPLFKLPAATPPGVSRIPTGGSKTVLVDRDGSSWFTNVSGEVHQFGSQALTTVRTADAMLAAGAVAAAADGSVWLATMGSYATRMDGDGLWRLDGQPHLVQPGQPGTATVALQSRSGDLLVAGDGWLWRGRKGRFQHDLPLPRADKMHGATGLLEHGSDHALWMTLLGAGLYRRNGDAWQLNGGIAGLPEVGATTLASDGRDTLWVGYADGQVRTITTGGGAAGVRARNARIGAVRIISIGHDTLVGGDRGLAALRGDALQALNPSIPGAFEGLTGMLQTRSGDVWLNGNAGLVHVRAPDLQAALAPGKEAEVRVRVFDASDGYPGGSGNKQPFGNTIAQAVDGRLWFTGIAKAASLDPATVRSEPTLSPLFLRWITTSAGRVAAQGQVQLAAGTRDVQVDYTALNYRHPDRERFRYRLVGLNEAWTDAGDRRQAFFTNLGPGRYRFEVQSHNETGDWSDSPTAHVDVDIPPTFLQSRMFMAICLGLAALALFGLMQWRIRHATRRAGQRERERMAVRIGERERIAREIHDTLLQNVQAVGLMIDAAVTLVRNGRPAEALLDRASTCAGEAIREARDRVFELRHKDNKGDDVAAELKAIGERLAEEPDAAAFSIAGTLPAMDIARSHEVLCIGREALLNAYRHAHASRVSVRMEHAGQDALLSVVDDGIGLEGQAQVPGHWGMAGMRERAKILGASLSITSVATGGTRVELNFRTRPDQDDPA